MFESAADNSSILSIDLGLLIGLLVMGTTPFRHSHFPCRIYGSISSLRSKPSP
jgi:hypothetical protein